MDIYVVDGSGNRVLQTSWTSSGTTTAFERVEFEAQAQAIELQGELDDSDWLSIMEVCIYRFESTRWNVHCRKPNNRGASIAVCTTELTIDLRMRPWS